MPASLTQSSPFPQQPAVPVYSPAHADKNLQADRNLPTNKNMQSDRNLHMQSKIHIQIKMYIQSKMRSSIKICFGMRIKSALQFFLCRFSAWFLSPFLSSFSISLYLYSRKKNGNGTKKLKKLANLLFPCYNQKKHYYIRTFYSVNR